MKHKTMYIFKDKVDGTERHITRDIEEAYKIKDNGHTFIGFTGVDKEGVPFLADCTWEAIAQRLGVDLKE